MSAVRKSDRRVERARDMRKAPTDAERKLWQRLRHFPNAHFRRQATIGTFFADFACHTTRLVIEVDGGQHSESASDEVRTAYLKDNGYRVLRFWNHDVLTNIDGVLELIASAVIVSPLTPDPSPPEGRGEGRRAEAHASPPFTPLLRGGEGSGVGGTSNTIDEDKTSSGGNT